MKTANELRFPNTRNSYKQNGIFRIKNQGKKAPGPSSIIVEMIKAASEVTVSVITHFLNLFPVASNSI